MRSSSCERATAARISCETDRARSTASASRSAHLLAHLPSARCSACRNASNSERTRRTSLVAASLSSAISLIAASNNWPLARNCSDDIVMPRFAVAARRALTSLSSSAFLRSKSSLREDRAASAATATDRESASSVAKASKRRKAFASAASAQRRESARSASKECILTCQSVSACKVSAAAASAVSAATMAACNSSTNKCCEALDKLL
mmetsp:Transcript_37068/g.107007  ORF Transcript_37068/g.107007 Transcript_37068/m.107007 type:complete len:208 (-) Transcript_37068:276-899(-)